MMIKLVSAGLMIVIMSQVHPSSGQAPESYRVMLRKGDSLFLAGNYGKAKDYYNRIVNDTTSQAQLLSRYGFTCFSLRDDDKAMGLFERALKHRPARPVKMNTFASMARIASRRNEKSQSLVWLDSAAQLGYANIGLVDSHDDFDNVRKEEKFKAIRQRINFSAFPCLGDPKAREFDFWIGDWDVYVTGTMTVAGHNKIELVSGGCALLENWDSPSSSGKSLNFIDPQTGKWKQTWVGSYTQGTQEFVDGEYRDGAMRFTFTARDPKGNKVMGRFIFFNEKPGQVRQFNETSSDGGKSWSTTYDFTYFRK